MLQKYNLKKGGTGMANYVLSHQENDSYVFGKIWGYGLRCMINYYDYDYVDLKVFFPLIMPEDPQNFVNDTVRKESFVANLIQYLLDMTNKKVFLANNGTVFMKGESLERIEHKIQEKGL